MAEAGPESSPLAPKPGLCPILHATCQGGDLKHCRLRAQPSKDGAPLWSRKAGDFTIQPHLLACPLWFSVRPVHSGLHTSHTPMLPAFVSFVLFAFSCLPSFLWLMKSYSTPQVSSSEVTSSGIFPSPKTDFTPCPLCASCHTLTFYCGCLPAGP